MRKHFLLQKDSTAQYRPQTSANFYRPEISAVFSITDDLMQRCFYSNAWPVPWMHILGNTFANGNAYFHTFEWVQTIRVQMGRAFWERAHTGWAKREGRFGNGYKLRKLEEATKKSTTPACLGNEKAFPRLEFTV